MRLWTLNKWLRRVGLVLVVHVDEDEGSELWLERAKTYDARVNPPASTEPFTSWIDRVPNIRKWMGERAVQESATREMTLSNPLPSLIQALERVQGWAEGSRLVWTCLECGVRSHAEVGEEREQDVTCWRGHSVRLLVPPDSAAAKETP